MIAVAIVVIIASIVLMVKRVDVRLVLLGAGLILASLTGNPLAFTDKFTQAMVSPMVAPICASMGFAAVLKATGCDRELVQLIMVPLRRARWAVLSGGIGAAYLVNLAVPSQSSTAAMLGPILIPIVVALGSSREVGGAALVLGASFGGDLLNPGCQDVQALAGVTGLKAASLSRIVIPSSLLGMLVAAFVFAFWNRAGRRDEPGTGQDVMVAGVIGDEDSRGPNVLKAIVPLVPVALLLLAHMGWRPLAWLLRVPEAEAWRPLAGALPVVRAMLIGVLVAGLIGWRGLPRLTRSLFDGMGTAYANVISLTIAAQCFGAGIAASGLGDALLHQVGGSRVGLAALSIGFPWGLAALSGSGSGPVLAFAQVCLVPLGDGPGFQTTAGVLSCLAAACGRTMSPVSAVVVCGAGLAGVSPLEIIRRLFPALILGTVVSVSTALLVR